MLPKFASHVLHHTQRAAQAAAQNHAFRNVLGLQNQGAASASSTNGPLSTWSNATSGSSWGGAGGAKYNTGSRFYQGYNGSGRAVTQANSSSAHDNSNGRTDDDEELPISRSSLIIKARTRPRSSSVHLTGTGRRKRAETFGVLQTVQLHQARHNHALAKAVGSNDIDAKDENSELVSSPRVLVRRNSTAASNVSDLESLESLETLEASLDVSPRPVSPKEASISTDPTAPQSVLSPVPAPLQDARDNAGEPANPAFFSRIEAARMAGDHARVVSEVLQFRASNGRLNTRDYNLALFALVSTRQGGQPITLILETYNEMLTRQISPNVRTYKTMLLALCERDREVERVCAQIEWRQKRRALAGRVSGNMYTTDTRQLELLRKEDNFGSAMLIFEAAHTLFRDKDNKHITLGLEIYSTLLRSCMIHANTKAAVRVFQALEGARGQKPDVTCYLHLLGTYTAANDCESAYEVFEDFLRASKEGVIEWPKVGRDELSTHILSDDVRSGQARTAQMLMWIKMIEAFFRGKQPVKAINLLEQMMDSKAGIIFGPADVPLPCTSVYTAFIRGFIENNDIESALEWFNRMLDQEHTARHPLLPSKNTPRPDQNAWNTMLEALIERKMLAEVNNKFKTLIQIADVEGLNVRMYDRISLFELNVNGLRHLKDKAFNERIKFITEYIVDKAFVDGSHPCGNLEFQTRTFGDFMIILTERGRANEAVGHFQKYVQRSLTTLRSSEVDVDGSAFETEHKRKSLQELINQVMPAMLLELPNLPVADVEKFQSAAGSALYTSKAGQVKVIMQLYALVKARNELKHLTESQWRMFAENASYLLSDQQDLLRTNDIKFKDLKSFIADISNAGYDLKGIWPQPSPEVCRWIMEKYGEKEALPMFEMLSHEWASVALVSVPLPEEQAAKVASPTVRSKKSSIRIEGDHSRAVDEYFPVNPKVSPQMAWSRYETGLVDNLYPTPDVIGRLIATFGRLGDLKKVHKLYEDGQRVLIAYEGDKERQSVGWYAIEDQMIIALAHAGQVEKAHVHRQRIIDQGGNPSPDAYGALIQCVRETTDDSANALALWQEAQMRGVVANLYLYNTVISKLSRARKADFALELFQQMKANYVRPSSVTYGAVIAACCRVGDAQSAEVLFEEMTSQKNFKPRIPPYNTMIQFYTHIVRNRERALHYFGALLSAGISPSAHTYKLLIDCYGTIEPPDINSMEDVFLRLVTDKRVQVQGVHWAALINAWGCVQKNLEKAISTFDSIASHPATRRSGVVLPDAIVYEAMINVLVTQRRTDLISSYLDRLSASQIHMTAYIANLLIKGYAAGGDLNRARQIFDSLQDPPVGHAAPNNHVPHSGTVQEPVPAAAPVYREPSTWEAMVRAELGSGNRDRAVALLQRVQERHFPPAVYARISGIMLDDSVSSWSPISIDLEASSSSFSN